MKNMKKSVQWILVMVMAFAVVGAIPMQVLAQNGTAVQHRRDEVRDFLSGKYTFAETPLNNPDFFSATFSIVSGANATALAAELVSEGFTIFYYNLDPPGGGALTFARWELTDGAVDVYLTFSGFGNLSVAIFPAQLRGGGGKLYVNEVAFSSLDDAADEIYYLLTYFDEDVVVTGSYDVIIGLLDSVPFHIPEGRTLTWNAQLTARAWGGGKVGIIDLRGGGEFILGQQGSIALGFVASPYFPDELGHSWAAIAESATNYANFGNNITISIYGTVTAYSGQGRGATGVVTFGGDIFLNRGTIYASGTESFAVRKNTPHHRDDGILVPTPDTTIGNIGSTPGSRLTGELFPATLDFGIVPPTGTPDITWAMRLMFAFAAAAAVLWGVALRGKKLKCK